jgi:hypothetical protein
VPHQPLIIRGPRIFFFSIIVLKYKKQNQIKKKNQTLSDTFVSLSSYFFLEGRCFRRRLRLSIDDVVLGMGFYDGSATVGNFEGEFLWWLASSL